MTWARGRSRLALAACALWLVGVEGLPALHEATHARLAPHRHDHGSIVTVSFEVARPRRARRPHARDQLVAASAIGPATTTARSPPGAT